MQYSVFRTETDNHVGYVNHRNEFVSMSVCASYETAQRQAEKLNQAQITLDQRQQRTGNRYLRRYVGR